MCGELCRTLIAAISTSITGGRKHTVARSTPPQASKATPQLFTTCSFPLHFFLPLFSQLPPGSLISSEPKGLHLRATTTTTTTHSLPSPPLSCRRRTSTSTTSSYTNRRLPNRHQDRTDRQLDGQNVRVISFLTILSCSHQEPFRLQHLFSRHFALP